MLKEGVTLLTVGALIAGCAPQGNAVENFTRPKSSGNAVATDYTEADAQKEAKERQAKGIEGQGEIGKRLATAEDVCTLRNMKGEVSGISFRSGQDLTDIRICSDAEGNEYLAGYSQWDLNDTSTFQDMNFPQPLLIEREELPDSEDPSNTWVIYSAKDGDSARNIYALNQNTNEVVVWDYAQESYDVDTTKVKVEISKGGKPRFSMVNEGQDVLTSFQKAGKDLSVRSTATPTPLTVEQAVTKTVQEMVTRTATKTATPKATATKTEVPTPTVDAETAAKIEAMREAVGDKPEDWLVFHGETLAYGGDLDMYEFKMVLVGEDMDARGQEIFNGEGEAVGKVIRGYKGEILIGNEIREITFGYWFQNYANGKCRLMTAYANEFDCTSLGDRHLAIERTVGRPDMMGGQPGQVVSVYINPPDGKEISYNEFATNFWKGQEDLYDALVTEGDTSIGVFVPAWFKFSKCSSDTLAKAPFQCNTEPAVVVPGYEPWTPSK